MLCSLGKSLTAFSRLKDSTSNNNDCTPYNFQDGGSGTTNYSGKVGGADYLGGDNDFQRCGNNSSLMPLNAITVEAWVYKVGTLPAWSTVLMKTSNASWENGYGLYSTADNKIRFWVNDYANATVATDFPDGWHHIVGTYDGINIKIYADGESKAAYGYSGSIMGNTKPLRIGAGLNEGADYFYYGAIDEVRISNPARSAKWIAAEYNNQNNPGSYMEFCQ